MFLAPFTGLFLLLYKNVYIFTLLIYLELKTITMKIGILVKSLLSQHKTLTTWRVLSINKGLSGKIRILCEAAHDTRHLGFDSIKHEFKLNEIEEI